MQVTEINLIRENNRKLFGSIMVRIPSVAEPVQKSGTARWMTNSKSSLELWLNDRQDSDDRSDRP
jgi:hypothetical protein